MRISRELRKFHFSSLYRLCRAAYCRILSDLACCKYYRYSISNLVRGRMLRRSARYMSVAGESLKCCKPDPFNRNLFSFSTANANFRVLCRGRGEDLRGSRAGIKLWPWSSYMIVDKSSPRTINLSPNSLHWSRISVSRNNNSQIDWYKWSPPKWMLENAIFVRNHFTCHVLYVGLWPLKYGILALQLKSGLASSSQRWAISGVHPQRATNTDFMYACWVCRLA